MPAIRVKPLLNKGFGMQLAVGPINMHSGQFLPFSKISSIVPLTSDDPVISKTFISSINSKLLTIEIPERETGIFSSINSFRKIFFTFFSFNCLIMGKIDPIIPILKSGLMSNPAILLLSKDKFLLNLTKIY